MTVTGASILVNPPEKGHIVYPYTSEERVVEAVGLYAASGLRNGDGIVMILSYTHCQAIEAALSGEGFDIASLKENGQFICADAARALSYLMVGGMPDRNRFASLVDPLIERARTGDNGTSRRIRAFGEMVSMLYVANPAAALKLEDYWNEVVERESICLLCTYQLGHGAPVTLQQNLCDAHSHYIA